MAADRRIKSWILITFFVSNVVKFPQFSKRSNPVPGKPGWRGDCKDYCMRWSVVLLLTLFFANFTLSVLGQRKKKEEAAKPEAPKSHLEHSLDTITRRLDNLHLTLNRINDFTSLGFNTRKVEQQLPEIGDNIQSIAENLSLSGTVPDFKSLQLYS